MARKKGKKKGAKKGGKRGFKKCLINHMRREKISTKKGARKAFKKASKACRKLAPKTRRHKHSRRARVWTPAVSRWGAF